MSQDCSEMKYRMVLLFYCMSHIECCLTSVYFLIIVLFLTLFYLGKSPNSSCLISEFECPANASIGGLLSAVCIAKKKVCNCIIDCSDGADEENCG